MVQMLMQTDAPPSPRVAPDFSYMSQATVLLTSRAPSVICLKTALQQMSKCFDPTDASSYQESATPHTSIEMCDGCSLCLTTDWCRMTSLAEQA